MRSEEQGAHMVHNVHAIRYCVGEIRDTTEESQVPHLVKLCGPAVEPGQPDIAPAAWKRG